MQLKSVALVTTLVGSLAISTYFLNQEQNLQSDNDLGVGSNDYSIEPSSSSHLKDSYPKKKSYRPLPKTNTLFAQELNDSYSVAPISQTCDSLLNKVEERYDQFMQGADEYATLDSEFLDTVGMHWQLREEYETGKISQEVYDKERKEVRQLVKSIIRDKGRVRKELRASFQEYQIFRKKTWDLEDTTLQEWDSLKHDKIDDVYTLYDMAEIVKGHTIAMIDFDDTFELGLFEQYE